jgi:hypothetical protein
VQVTIREAIVAMLNGLAPLTAIVGSKIYWTDASQQMVYPCLICTVDSRQWGHNLAGADGTSTADFTFTAASYSESQSFAISKTVRLALDSFQGLQSGVYILRSFITDESDSTFTPPDGSDQFVYAVTVPYEIVHRVPFPQTVTQTDV